MAGRPKIGFKVLVHGYGYLVHNFCPEMTANA